MPNLDRPVEDTHSIDHAAGPPDKQEWTRDIRAHYVAVTQEPLPDDIQQLLNALAQQVKP